MFICPLYDCKTTDAAAQPHRFDTDMSTFAFIGQMHVSIKRKKT